MSYSLASACAVRLPSDRIKPVVQNPFFCCCSTGLTVYRLSLLLLSLIDQTIRVLLDNCLPSAHDGAGHGEACFSSGYWHICRHMPNMFPAPPAPTA